MTKRRLVLDQFLPYRLSAAANAVSRLIAQSYEKPTGLRTNEWRLIAVLAEDGELTQRDIGERTRMDKVSVSRAATVLSNRGLVRRAQDPADARSLLLSLTPEGRRLHARLAPKALALEAALVRALPSGEVGRLEKLLRQVEESAMEILSKSETSTEEEHRKKGGTLRG